MIQKEPVVSNWKSNSGKMRWSLLALRFVDRGNLMRRTTTFPAPEPEGTLSLPQHHKLLMGSGTGTLEKAEIRVPTLATTLTFHMLESALWRWCRAKHVVRDASASLDPTGSHRRVEQPAFSAYARHLARLCTAGSPGSAVRLTQQGTDKPQLQQRAKRECPGNLPCAAVLGGARTSSSKSLKDSKSVQPFLQDQK